MGFGELPFSDLFISVDPMLCGFKSTSDALEVQALPPELAAEAAALFSVLEARKTPGSDFRATWPESGAHQLTMRVKKITLSTGTPMYVLRRYAVPIAQLGDLGMPEAYRNKLLSQELRSGLVVFIGPPGSGKTTTAYASVIERLQKFGGVAWTAENPFELAAEGRYGKGVLYQTEVSDDKHIVTRMRDFYRASPTILMVGEIRTAAVAMEVMSAAGSGYLVFTTFHGNSLPVALSRLARLAGGGESVHALADVLQVAMHLQLRHADSDALEAEALHPVGKGLGTPPRVLVCQPLFVTEGDSATAGIRSKLRDGQYHQLQTDMDQQRRRGMSFEMP